MLFYISSVCGGLCSFGVLVGSVAISRDCCIERDIINSWMQNKRSKLLQNQISSFAAFSCAVWLLFFDSWSKIALAILMSSVGCCVKLGQPGTASRQGYEHNILFMLPNCVDFPPRDS